MKTVNTNQNKNEKNEEGILTLDFIFSILAVYAISMVFALLSLTLMFSTVAQYIAFSMSRAHISAHINPELQQQATQEQMTTLMNSRLGVLIKLTNEGWFKIESDAVATEHFGLSSSDDGGEVQKAYGVQLRYTSNILKRVRLPLLGNPGDNADEGFGVANIYSFLYREPTTQECLDFNNARWNAIKEKFPRISDMGLPGNKNYGSEADNGC